MMLAACPCRGRRSIRLADAAQLSEELLPAQLVVPHRDERSADRINACIDQFDMITQVTATAIWRAEGNYTSIRR